MYICKPERSEKQTRILLFCCLLVTITLFFLSTVILQFGAFIRFCGVIALVISIMLIVRYSLTEFEYSVGNGAFSVTKIVGNKRTVVCSIALETAIELYSKRDYDHLPSVEKGIIKYTLTQNPVAESYVFLCEFNGKRTMVEFEPNVQFVSIVKDEIAKAKRDSNE
ncbi:MAG: hypothetical protein IKK70_01690 [Clostridia bacterium]|nr:hypothetical protein [Clostridia bacterium]